MRNKDKDGVTRTYWTLGSVEVCFRGFFRELEIVVANRRIK